MTDSKKRLKKILNKLLFVSPHDTSRESQNAKKIDKAIIEISEEFVYKDNLPNKGKIEIEIQKHTKISDKYYGHRVFKSSYDKKDLARAIRKLIEGKK